jgi:putative hydrolase of the HAD superfamily
MIANKYIVFFDVGNTLIHTSKSVSDIYAEFGKKHNFNIDASEIEKRLKLVWNDMISKKVSKQRLKYGIDDFKAREWWKEFVSRIFNYSNSKGDIDLLFEDLYYYFSTKDPWEIYNDALSVLKRLRGSGFSTGIISNWDVRLSNILDEIGLNKYFDYIFISCEVGYEKPDHRIFDYALNKSGFSSSNCFHIGDSYKEDVEGALAVGITPIFIKRERQFTHFKINKNKYNNVKEVHNLKEVISIIEKETGLKI